MTTKQSDRQPIQIASVAFGRPRNDSKPAVLLIGFGGPTKPEEVRPFLASVLDGSTSLTVPSLSRDGVKVPAGRMEEVAKHYQAIGGVSPYNAHTLKQKSALEAWFRRNGAEIPVLAVFLHSRPSFADAVSELKKNRIEKTAGFVLSSLRCPASFEKYTEKMGKEGIEISYTAPFHTDPLFISAQAARLLETVKLIPEKELPRTHFLFTAHSIPVTMAKQSGYDAQFKEMAGLVAAGDRGDAIFGAQLHDKNSAPKGRTRRSQDPSPYWSVAYQSRSGRPSDPWVEPDVKTVIMGLRSKGFANVVLIPAGFLCDNVEVIYDLDVEARALAEAEGLGYFRASTVMDHPDFIEMMGRRAMEVLGTAR